MTSYSFPCACRREELYKVTFDDGDVDVLGATDVHSGVQVYEVYGEDRWKRDDRASGAYHAGDDGGGREEHKEPWGSPSPLPARLSIGSMNGARGAGRESLRGKEKARGRGAATAGANGDDGEEEGARPRKKPREARGRHN